MSVNKRLTRAWHWTLALALLPLLWAVLHQTGRMIPALLGEGFSSWWRYAAGALVYVLLERFLTKPMWLYVVGHELTHAVSGILSGARIHSFKASSSRGEVRLSKSNAFIALSPYVFPIYGVVLILIYVVTRHWWNPPQLKPVFQFLLGWTVAFHVSLTFHAMHKHQSDLKIFGFFLSGVLIMLGNLLILGVLGITLFTKTPTFSTYGTATMKDTAKTWQQMYQFLKDQPWTR